METYFDNDCATHASKFMSQLPHTQGEWAGQAIPLLDWEEEIVREVFGTLREDSTRQYRTVYIEVPKKNGKTTFASRIALYLAYADGERGAEVYFAATDRDQAGICYRAARDSVEQTSLKDRSTIVDSVKRIVYPSTGSFLQVLSADVKKHHGLNVHGAVIDELHAHPNRDLYDVLTKGSGEARRQPLFVVITTAGYDRNSICYELHNRTRQIEKGIISDPTFYGKIYGLEDEDDWEDEENWKRVNPSLGHIFSIDRLREAYQAAKGNPAEESLFRRLRLNQWTAQETRWIDIREWDKCNEPLPNLDGQTAYGGLDLASTTDLAAFSLVFPDNGNYNILMRFWIPKDTAGQAERRDRVPYQTWAKQGYITLTEGNVIDYSWIRYELNELAKKYNIAEIAFDRWGATKLVQELEDDGFTVVPFGQGYASMSPPTKELMNLILGRKLRHSDNPVLRWNADNMTVAQDPAGNLKPDKAKATQKIDGVVATIMGLDRALRNENANKPSIYETRGF